jgi:hypothetical protein
MKPKQNAQTLVNEYLNASFNCKDCDMPFCDVPCTMLNLSEAKQCALIAVNNIISANPHSNPLNSDVHSTMNYWFEVKQEIENL